MADTSKDGLPLLGGICHVIAMPQFTREINKFLIVYIILFNPLIFSNTPSACAKEYFTAAMY